MGESRRAWLGEKGGHGLKMGICMRNDFCCVCATYVASCGTNFWLIQMWPFFFVLVVATFFLLLKGKYSIIDLEFEISLENLGKLYSIVFLFTFFFQWNFFWLEFNYCLLRRKSMDVCLRNPKVMGFCRRRPRCLIIRFS